MRNFETMHNRYLDHEAFNSYQPYSGVLRLTDVEFEHNDLLFNVDVEVSIWEDQIVDWGIDDMYQYSDEQEEFFKLSKLDIELMFDAVAGKVADAIEEKVGYEIQRRY